MVWREPLGVEGVAQSPREEAMGRFSVAGSIALALAVILGAFGAHALRGLLPPDRLAIWETANRYHFYHGLALFLVEVVAMTVRTTGAPSRSVTMAGVLFLAGLFLFSGSLYLLAYSGLRWLGAITPLGGVAWIVGWLLLAYGGWRR